LLVEVPHRPVLGKLEEHGAHKRVAQRDGTGQREGGEVWLETVLELCELGENEAGFVVDGPRDAGRG
jgi:hypothetical protein